MKVIAICSFLLAGISMFGQAQLTFVSSIDDNFGIVFAFADDSLWVTSDNSNLLIWKGETLIERVDVNTDDQSPVVTGSDGQSIIFGHGSYNHVRKDTNLCTIAYKPNQYRHLSFQDNTSKALFLVVEQRMPKHPGYAGKPISKPFRLLYQKDRNDAESDVIELAKSDHPNAFLSTHITKKLVISCDSRNVNVWKKKKIGKLAAPDTLFHHETDITDIDVNEDGSSATSVDYDGTICVWDLKSLEPQILYQSPDSAFFTQVVFISEHQMIATGTDDGLVSVWKIEDGGLVPACSANVEGSVAGLAYNPYLDQLFVSARVLSVFKLEQ